MCVGFRCVIMGLSWFEPRSNACFFFSPSQDLEHRQAATGVCRFHLTLNHGISPIQKYGELLVATPEKDRRSREPVTKVGYLPRGKRVGIWIDRDQKYLCTWYHYLAASCRTPPLPQVAGHSRPIKTTRLSGE